MLEGRWFQKTGGAPVIATACAVTICLASAGGAGLARAGVQTRPDPAPLWKQFPLNQPSARTHPSGTRPSKSHPRTRPAKATHGASSSSDRLRLVLLIGAGLGALVAILSVLSVKGMLPAGRPVSDARGNRTGRRANGSAGSPLGSDLRPGGRAAHTSMRAAAFAGARTAQSREHLEDLADAPIPVGSATGAGVEGRPSQAAPAPALANRLAAPSLGTAADAVLDDQPRPSEPVTTVADPTARAGSRPSRKVRRADLTICATALGAACAIGWLIPHLIS